MSTGNYKVLVADDEYWVRENLRTMLEWQEYSFDFLEPAVDGEDVLLRVEKERPDILITDINMPFINGVELVKVIKNKYPQVVIVILSGYSDFDYVRNALLEGAIDYLLKPLARIDLINTLAKALEVISRNNTLQREKESIREELLHASSLLADKEFSMLLAGEVVSEQDNTKKFQGMEMELGFIGFSLVLIKISNLNLISKKKFKSNASLLSYEIKNEIAESVKDGKLVIFNNIYAASEFVLLSDLDKTKLNKIADNILQALDKFLESTVNIAVSNYYYSLDKVHKAYKEVISALMSKKYNRESSKIHIEDVKKIPIKKRMNGEHENKLIFAIQSKNKKLVKQLIFEDVGLRFCHSEGWLLIEVKQTVSRFTGILINNITEDKSTLEILTIENLIELLDRTIETFDIAESCCVLEQIIDECFEIKDSYTANDSLRHVVKRVIEYINENYFEDISLNYLAKLFLVDGAYISKLFKWETGENLMLYIAKKRIEKAVELIKQGDMSLTDISSIVGYSDYAYFNRVFRKIMGKSPREYKALQS